MMHRAQKEAEVSKTDAVIQKLKKKKNGTACVPSYLSSACFLFLRVPRSVFYFVIKVATRRPASVFFVAHHKALGGAFASVGICHRLHNQIALLLI